jgi:hypothetical protein
MKQIDINQKHKIEVSFSDPYMDLAVLYPGNIRDVIEAWKPNLLSDFDQWALETYAERRSYGTEL